MNGTAPETMEKAEKLDVEASRTKRLERVKAKQRDRGGIFQPSDSNPLRDVLMSRNFPTKSPVKPRVSKARQILNSRKSIGVPKTPRKSLSIRPPIARKSLGLQKVQRSDNPNDSSKENETGKISKRTNKKSGTAVVPSKSFSSSAVAAPTTDSREDNNGEQAGPSTLRKAIKVPIASRLDKLVKQPYESEGNDKPVDSELNAKKATSRPRKVPKGPKYPESKAKSKRKSRGNALTSKGKEKEVATDNEEDEQVQGLSINASKSSRKKKRKDSESSGCEATSGAPRRKKTKHDPKPSVIQDSEHADPDPPVSKTRRLDTIDEEDEVDPVSKKKSKRRLDDGEPTQTSSKKARTKGKPDKKSVTFAKSPEKTKRRVQDEKEKETAHSKATEASNVDSERSSKKSSTTAPREPSISTGKKGAPPHLNNSDALQAKGSEEPNGPSLKKENPSSSKSAKSVSDAPLLTTEEGTRDKSTSESKPPSSKSLSTRAPFARLKTPKPDMGFKMRSVSYPSTTMGSPLKVLDSEQDPIDFL